MPTNTGTKPDPYHLENLAKRNETQRIREEANALCTRYLGDPDFRRQIHGVLGEFAEPGARP